MLFYFCLALVVHMLQIKSILPNLPLLTIWKRNWVLNMSIERIPCSRTLHKLVCIVYPEIITVVRLTDGKLEYSGVDDWFNKKNIG